MKNDKIQGESTSNENLVERIWERFENITFENSVRYTGLYNEMTEYLKALTDNESNNLWEITDKMSNEDYFYFIFDIIKESDKEFPIIHSNEGLILANEIV